MHEREIEGKIEENEDNRGLNDKNPYGNQLVSFATLTFVSVLNLLRVQWWSSLSPFSLSYSSTLRKILVNCWSMLGAL